MSSQATSPDTHNVTSSPESADGALPYVMQDGRIPDQFGPDPVHVSLSAAQASSRRLLMRGTFGQPGSGSSASQSLASFLASRLRARLAGRGSILFRLTWKHWVTPLGRTIYALRALAPRTSASASTGWPTATARDGANARNATAKRSPGAKRANPGVTLVDAASWATPNAQDCEAAGGPQQTSLTNQATGRYSKPASPRATPTTRDHKDGTSKGTAPTNALLGRQAWLATGSNAQTEDAGRLNPELSRWLMGYPRQWSSCAATATR